MRKPPHSHVRQITRSLATWAEAEVGKFHRRISAIMFLAATLVCSLGLVLWAGKPGTGLFVITLVVSVNFLIYEIRAILESPVSAVGKAGPVLHRVQEGAVGIPFRARIAGQGLRGKTFSRVSFSNVVRSFNQSLSGN
jgi:hypothetical protein